MPILLEMPLVSFVVMVMGSVVTRRGAAGWGQFTLGVMLLATLYTAYARLRKSGFYEASYQWVNIQTAFQGDSRFQGFGIDLSFRLDHAALAALTAVLIVMLAALTWHRVAGRGEQGPIRFQVSAVLLALGAAGTLVSGDTAELLGFWMLAGVASFLLLGHRWGTEGAGRRGRLALALPFVGDMALFAAVAFLYSRYGTTTLTTLYPQLPSTVGVGLKSTTVAALLIAGAVFVRAGLWPFSIWLTGALEAPAAALVMVAGVWPVLAGMVLLRMLPVFGAAGAQGPRITAYALGLAAVAGPALALLGSDIRRSLVLAGSGALALALLGVLYPQSIGLGLTAVLAVAAARTGLLLAGTAAAGTMRTTDLRAMGGGWERMPRTSLGLLVGGLVLALSGVAPAILRPRSLAWVAFAAGLALVTVAGLRAYLAVAHGPLRRRRAFEPERVREVVPTVWGSALTAAGLGALALIAAFIPRWVSFLEAGGKPVGLGPQLAWFVVPVAAAAVAAVAITGQKDRWLQLGAQAGERLGQGWELVGGLYGRWVARPGRQAVHAVEDVGLDAVEGGVARGLAETGGLAGLVERSAPWAPTVLGLAVALAVAFGLLSQGLHR